MSDFGTMIGIYHASKKALPERDQDRITALVRRLRAETSYEDYLGEPFGFKIGSIIDLDNAEGISITLSEYWLEAGEITDDGIDEILQFDRTCAEHVLDQLKTELGSGYRYELIIDTW